MIHIHRWEIVAENERWKLKRCKKCNLQKWNENLLATYQPRPIENGNNYKLHNLDLLKVKRIYK